MGLFTVTQPTLNSSREPNDSFEVAVGIELGVTRILTSGIILTTSSFTWHFSEEMGYQWKFGGAPGSS